MIGKNIEINSTSGAIGAKSAVVNGATTLTNINPLVIQATGTVQANSTVDGGVLDSASATGTYIIQSKGDLRLGTIQSTGGPVFLEAAGSDGNQANILNGRAAVGLTAGAEPASAGRLGRASTCSAATPPPTPSTATSRW